jgi:hypothetical protein
MTLQRQPRAGVPRTLALLPVLVVFAYWAHDWYREATATGLYSQNWSGEVVKVRPTLKNIVTLFDGERRRQDSWNDRHNRALYSATLTGDDGRTFEVGLSRDDFMKVLVPSYVVSRSGKVSVYRDREAAVAAGAAGEPSP